MRKIDRTDETSVATNGMTMTIIAYRGATDMDVRFKDGAVRKHVAYKEFKTGKISHPKDIECRENLSKTRIGETSVATNGMTMTIIAYRGSKDIDVQFKDGTERKHVDYWSFKKGYIRYPKEQELKTNSSMTRIGEIRKARNGQTMRIVEYNTYNNIIVEFNDKQKTRVKTRYSSFKRGEVKNPNYIRHKRIGETNKATNGQAMTIVEYDDCNNIIAEFNDKQNTRVKTEYSSFKRGEVKNPNFVPHIGETNKATNGQTMTIVEYIDYYNTIVEFDDINKTRVKTSYHYFKEGRVRNPNYLRNKRIGEITIATNGQKMTIVEYKNVHDIIVEFDDEFHTKVKTRYRDFKRGIVKNPNYTSNPYDNGRIGEVSVATNGQIIRIIKYTNSKRVIVEFDDKYQTKSEITYDLFRKGKVKNPHFPMKGTGTYNNFQTQYAYTAPDGSVYFYCKCQECGWKKNLTARELMNLNHTCENIEGSEI